MRKQKPQPELEPFTPEQLKQMARWLDCHSYQKVQELVLNSFGHDIDVGVIRRFRAKACAGLELESVSELGELSTEYLAYIATGNPRFDAAAIEIMKKRAFELALTREDFSQLKGIFAILNHTAKVEVHQRMAAVQEQKLKLRERELALKETIATTRSSSGSARVPRAHDAVPPEQSPKEPTPKNPWEMNEEEKAAWFKSINKVKSEEAIERDWLKVGMDRKIYRQYLAAIPNPTTEDRDAAQRACIIRPKIESTSLNGETAPRACSSVPVSPEVSEPSSSVTNVQPTAAEFPEGNVQPETKSSLSLEKGPLSAEQTSLDGHLTCGGVGNSLGPGEGFSSHPRKSASSAVEPKSQIQNQKSKIEASVRDHLHRRALEWQRNGKYIRPTIYREC